MGTVYVLFWCIHFLMSPTNLSLRGKQKDLWTISIAYLKSPALYPNKFHTVNCIRLILPTLSWDFTLALSFQSKKSKKASTRDLYSVVFGLRYCCFSCAGTDILDVLANNYNNYMFLNVMKSIFVDWKIEHYNLHCYNGCRKPNSN